MGLDQLDQPGTASAASRERLDEALGRLDLLEAIEAREVLEGSLVRLAADRRTEWDLVRVVRAVRRMRESIDDRRAFIEADLELHIALSEAAGNGLLAGRLIALHDHVKEMIALFTDTAFREGSVPELVVAHENLAGAVCRRDADQAHRIMTEMMARLRDEAAGVLSAQSRPSTVGESAVQSKGEHA